MTNVHHDGKTLTYDTKHYYFFFLFFYDHFKTKKRQNPTICMPESAPPASPLCRAVMVIEGHGRNAENDGNALDEFIRTRDEHNKRTEHIEKMCMDLAFV